jgi:hypothetical protein
LKVSTFGFQPLLKDTKMNKTIEEAAIEHALNAADAVILNGEMETNYVERARFSFIVGANFALSHQWRRVEDELPPGDEKVLCRLKSNGVIVSGFINKSKRTGRLEVFISPGFYVKGYGNSEPTHWMPIPLVNEQKMAWRK